MTTPLFCPELLTTYLLSCNSYQEKQSIKIRYRPEILNEFIKTMDMFPTIISQEPTAIMAISQNGGYLLTKAEDILHCEAEGNYARIYFRDATSLVVNKSIKELELILPEQSFVRVHHSHLININGIKRYIKGEGGKIILKNDQIVDVSRRKKTELMKFFTII